MKIRTRGSKGAGAAEDSRAFDDWASWIKEAGVLQRLLWSHEDQNSWIQGCGGLLRIAGHLMNGPPGLKRPECCRDCYGPMKIRASGSKGAGAAEDSRAFDDWASWIKEAGVLQRLLWSHEDQS
ncbi:hypothetical protein NDU88_007433 [Pleurodeles waltl]|uniref:Uncharacterized protein n=1 Tax=Pleurodeles waltl TaxID=8319 RepID=A0AAV7SSR2_PLEWA|nr:hypothetical protein NDU88_007433 [Pleurodeles waltl]